MGFPLCSENWNNPISKKQKLQFAVDAFPKSSGCLLRSFGRALISCSSGPVCCIQKEGTKKFLAWRSCISILYCCFWQSNVESFASLELATASQRQVLARWWPCSCAGQIPALGLHSFVPKSALLLQTGRAAGRLLHVDYRKCSIFLMECICVYTCPLQYIVLAFHGCIKKRDFLPQVSTSPKVSCRCSVCRSKAPSFHSSFLSDGLWVRPHPVFSLSP